MKIRWFGQSAFLLSDDRHRVFIDPFGDIDSPQWSYPPIEGVDADVLLVTHEHRDHNVVDAIGGEPTVLRGAGTHESPLGDVVGVASEHDDVAGTRRGANAIVRFELGGLRVAHFGDFGQPALRPEQRAALGDVDVVFFPAGGGPTTPVADAAALLRELGPRVVVPMHYRTPHIEFLDPLGPFVDALGWPVTDVAGPETELAELPAEPTLLKLTLT
jgi:L-ascorbate metabolism protein UlaG (beta-lactamase superfamily)